MATKFGPKNCTHKLSARNREIYRLYDGISGLLNFNTLSEFLREPRELPWQLNLNKNKQKLHWFQFCTRNRGIFRMKSQYFGSATSNMLSQFLRKPRDLPWQPNLNKNKPKLHWFQSCARNRGMFRMKSQDSRSATSNMLSQFSRRPRELPWQPNSEKYKPKLHKFLFLAKNRRIFRMFSMVLCSLI